MTQEQYEEEKKQEEEKRLKTIEEYGDPGSGYEWSSGVDSDGKPIKKEGEESEESEWYYQEDKELYESGNYCVINELLNINSIYADGAYPEEEEESKTQKIKKEKEMDDFEFNEFETKSRIEMR